MICFLCEEEITESDERAAVIGTDAHRECMLRSVIGGIGHLIDHAHFCKGEKGPDAGLDYRTSALLVDVYVYRKGVEVTAAQRS